MSRKKVAIVGSGCAGIGALWALQHTEHDIHLYESEDRLGGHTNTVTFEHDGHNTNVDTGFIVLNTATYPNFISFLKQLDVETLPTEMTFGVSRDQGAFEWAGTSLSAVFAQRSNIFRPRMWRMIFDIIRFNQFALDLLVDESQDLEEESHSSTGKAAAPPSFSFSKQISIGEYLEREGYSDAFRDDYLIPMTAAVWSTSPDKCSLEFPAMTLVRFMWNHHLLSTVRARPKWLTLKHGGKAYIDAVMKRFPSDRIHLSTPIASASSSSDGRVLLRATRGTIETFDHVILATHGDQARQIILQGGATEEELDILSCFQTSANTAVLHSDLSLMPTRPLSWSAWNYLTRSSPDATSSNAHPSPPRSHPEVCLTYNMNMLQHIPQETYGHVLVTLNPLTEPDLSLVRGRWTYQHPLYNAAAVSAQARLPRIQNTRGISYAGAWTKYGFHEDGFSSGLKVAIEHLGAEIPFEFVDSTFSRGKRPVLGWEDWMVRIAVLFVQCLIAIWGTLVLGRKERIPVQLEGILGRWSGKKRKAL
ncbi:amine oxidase [Xylona heveae TC161]|uniref:Amine oxidase n=1 Tax=Xylona heveae (strain CBS 132557 / TC161) TaxID=1328760 RepID=A0A165A4G3_XYLHT|nr:amine oxidase [Xylona heveae TC161]KZF19933.1 amine oxidase [Xylona heveae TC161]